MIIEPNVIAATKAAAGKGMQVKRRVSTADINAVNLVSGPCSLYGWSIVNTNAAVRYLKLYDMAGVPAPASDVPKLVISLPASGGQCFAHMIHDVPFALGLSMVLVTAIADTSVAAVAAGEQLVQLFTFQG